MINKQQYQRLEYEEAQRLGSQAVPFRDGEVYCWLSEAPYRAERALCICSESVRIGWRKQDFSFKRKQSNPDEKLRKVLDELEQERGEI